MTGRVEFRRRCREGEKGEWFVVMIRGLAAPS
jgi:hypothetical protein